MREMAKKVIWVVVYSWIMSWGFEMPGRTIAAVYFVRPEGGTSSQCTGLSDAPYSASSPGDCAWSHPFWALEGGEPPSWKIQGGDTLILFPGNYQMGFGAPNSDWCSMDYPYDCHLPPLPSGADADHPTRILGVGWDQGCPDAPELWGTERAYHIVDLSGTSNAEIRCLELTDHSGCVESHADPDVRCQRDSYPYGTWASTGLYASGASSILLERVEIHGFASYAVEAGGLRDWTLKDVRLAGNGWGGWNGDLADGEDSNGGTLRFDGVIVEWNGCGESYPESEPHSCWGQTAGGYGDGLGTGTTGGHWKIEDSVFRYNTSDGLDLLYAREPGTQIDIERSHAYGNAGDQFKTNGPARIENCLIVSDCGFFDEKSFTYHVDHCRAGGSSVALTLREGNQVSLIHSTIAGEGDVLLLVECAEGTCENSEVIVVNNIFHEYHEFSEPTELSSYIWYEPDLFGTRQIHYNLLYASDGQPRIGNVSLSDRDLNENPQLTDNRLESFDYRLNQNSPAIDAALLPGSLNGLIPTHDINGTSRPYGGGSDMGCHEYTGGNAPGTSSPIPDIKANGQDTSISVASSDMAAITIGMDPGNREGKNADWWIVAASATDFYSLVVGPEGFGWKSGIKRCIEMEIISFSTLSIPPLPKSVGTSVLYFGVDDNADGILDATWWDAVEVRVLSALLYLGVQTQQ